MAPIFWLVIAGLIIVLLLIFKDNELVKPIAEFVNVVILLVVSVFVGSVLGFFIGYLLFGQILGVNIPINALFTTNSDLANIFIGSIKQKVFISTIVGALLGVIVCLMIAASEDAKKEKTHTIGSKSDELLKLNELKEKGIITAQEFDKEKKKLLDS